MRIKITVSAGARIAVVFRPPSSFAETLTFFNIVATSRVSVISFDEMEACTV